ncbi:CBS domain-containing protein [Yinghuangia seranimata]|uniref:CBS domain-containing protein n=1 Tax=Yinghuangia seranimata TaxID=408067 RepID=UPI00248C5DFD|nr:CBS domain-containing protein [Yinghuangia seranimata]MDI2124795.1 CBS domain-containing protein [Yinghuangia seranimata]
MNAHTQQPPPSVGQVMHSPVVSVGDQDTLWTAMDLMLGRGLRHLVVVRGDKALGVLVDRELAAVWAMSPLGLKQRTVLDTMAPAQSFLTPEVDVVTAAQRMRVLGVDALVVVDRDQHPLGVVTDHDLLGVLAQMLGGAGEDADTVPRYHGSGYPVMLPD